MLPPADDGGGGERPRELGLTACGPGGAGACASRGLGPRDAAAVGGHSRPPRDARPRVQVVEPHAAEHCPQAGHRAQAIPWVRVMGPGGLDAGAVEGTAHRLIVATAGARDGHPVLPGGSATTVSAAGALGFRGDGLAERRPVSLARGMVDGREACSAVAPQVPAASAEITSGPPRGGRARRRGEPSPAPPHGAGRGLNRVVYGLAPREGLPVAGLPAAQRPPVCSTPVRTPVPGAHPGGRDAERLASGGEGLAPCRRGGLQVTVPPRLTGLVKATPVQGAGRQRAAAGTLGRCGGDAPEVSAAASRVFPSASRPCGRRTRGPP
jgi:hypothetical protein